MRLLHSTQTRCDKFRLEDNTSFRKIELFRGRSSIISRLLLLLLLLLLSHNALKVSRKLSRPITDHKSFYLQMVPVNTGKYRKLLKASERMHQDRGKAVVSCGCGAVCYDSFIKVRQCYNQLHCRLYYS